MYSDQDQGCLPSFKAIHLPDLISLITKMPLLTKSLDPLIQIARRRDTAGTMEGKGLGDMIGRILQAPKQIEV